MYIHLQFLHLSLISLCPLVPTLIFSPALQSTVLTEIHQNRFLFGDEIFKDSYELKRRLNDAKVSEQLVGHKLTYSNCRQVSQ